jgi:DNA-binding GntR family transcriptional regulator
MGACCWLVGGNSPLPSAPKNANETLETEKAPFLVVKRIREAILDGVFKPGDHLGEVELSEKFEVSRSPVREALIALEKEGTLIANPYRGAICAAFVRG